MSLSTKFDGWDKLDLHDLLAAYRKAKSDCFYESTFPVAIKFANYEKNLLENLNTLLNDLKDGGGFESFIDELIGDFRVVPKKLKVKNNNKNDGHVHFSDPIRSFDYFKKNNIITPEFRIIGDFPITTHIISALWINLIGEKFDSCLDSCCYGARLKRIINEDEIDKSKPKPFHIRAIGSFVPYFSPYKKWRNDGIKAIRSSLEREQDVVAISLDLKSYYHNIDPSFIMNEGFLNDVGINLDNYERLFTSQLMNLLTRWSEQSKKYINELIPESDSENINGGLVIGLTVSRIISNILLRKWDRLVCGKITPIHYGRYVDDMILVLPDNGEISSLDDFFKFIQSRLGKIGRYFILRKDNLTQDWKINLGVRYQAKSSIMLQPEKQKLFILNSDTGNDFLDSIEKEIHDLSSEYRLMPSPDLLDNSTATSVLSASSSAGERADTLRKADGLTIQRLSWSLQLSHVETLSRDIPKDLWKEQREEFYQFAHNYIIQAEHIFNHYMYLPRLLGFAVGLGEWRHAEKIVRASFHEINKLKNLGSPSKGMVINGKDFGRINSKIWDKIEQSLAWSFIEETSRNYQSELMNCKKSSRPLPVNKIEKIFLQKLAKRIHVPSFLDFMDDSNLLFDSAPLLAFSDLSKIPYKKFLSRRTSEIINSQYDSEKDRFLLSYMEEANLVDKESLIRFKKCISKFLKLSKNNIPYRPYLFPTRPYTPIEIAEIDPKCIGIKNDSGYKYPTLWAMYVRSLRGVWVKPYLLSSENETQDKNESYLLRIGNRKNSKIKILLSNMLTKDQDWSLSAAGTPNLSLTRYKQLATIVNDAIKMSPRPDYLLFPELSIPKE